MPQLRAIPEKKTGGGGGGGFVHQLPIEFNFPKAQWCKIPHPLPCIGETSGSTRKMHLEKKKPR